MAKGFHIPKPPQTPEPEELVELARSIYHPEINRVGLTTTDKGLWALLVITEKGVTIPIKEVEEKCINYPVIYREDNDSSTVARPAYPGSGE